MKKTAKTKSPKDKLSNKEEVIDNTKPVSAVALLRAEYERLTVMAQNMKGKGKQTVEGMAWAYNVSAAFLGALNAPERIIKFKEVKEDDAT
jgi:hypothetical protein